MGNCSGHWRPILTGSDADRLSAVIDSIAESLTKRMDSTAAAQELYQGAPGVALFFAYLCKARRLKRWLPEAARALHMAMEGSFAEDTRPTFLQGRPGVIWTAHHLAADIETADLDRLTHDAEQLVLARIAAPPEVESYELFQGLVGLVRFGLDRLDDTQGRRIVQEGVARLLQRAEPIDGGVTWWTEVEARGASKAPRHIRLGLAHGVPGAIAILAEAVKAGMAPEATRPVLDRAVRWLLAQRNPEHMTSRFGTIIMPEPDGIDRSTARLAWCWGDLGIAIALHSAALNLGEVRWADDALDLARHAARRPMYDARVIEAGICHGATGAGHIFNRLYQNTREEIFVTAARQWFDQAIAYAAGPEEIAVETPKGEQKYRPWPIKPGLLTGLAGVGLALLAATTDIEPRWDRALLIDVPPRPDTRVAEASATARHSSD